MEKLLTIKDVCELLQVSQALVYKWVHYDFIPHVKIGSLLRFKSSELDKWVKVRQKRGRSAIKFDVNSLVGSLGS